MQRIYLKPIILPLGMDFVSHESKSGISMMFCIMLCSKNEKCYFKENKYVYICRWIFDFKTWHENTGAGDNKT